MPTEDMNTTKYLNIYIYIKHITYDSIIKLLSSKLCSNLVMYFEIENKCLSKATTKATKASASIRIYTPLYIYETKCWQ